MVDITKKLICKKSKVVPAGATLAVDSLPLVGFAYSTYSVRYKSADLTKTRSLKLDVFLDDTEVNDQVYSKGGSKLNIAICSAINGSAVELVVTNNELFDVEVCLLRSKL